jgi:cold shock protein
MKIWFLMCSSVLGLVLAGCGGHGVVESGTYKGSVTKVVPEKLEIYVQIDDGPEIELYFKDFTTLSRGEESVEFSALSSGQKIEVDVRKTGNRMDPLAVRILPE